MQTDIVIRNSDASGDLTLSLRVTVNTPEEKIFSNILENSRRIKKWVKLEEANDKTLLICASGPSVKRDLNLIQEYKNDGAVVWGLNNCATWLFANGIEADYQVIMDAQEKTSNVVGQSKDYLFASQVDPLLFDMKPLAILWQATYGDFLVDELDGFPQHDADYCMIGSSIAVGNTSLVLAYVMGFRNIHIFGMDSCHENMQGHVIHQFINDGDPLTVIKFAGKEYISSLTMKLQADYFMERVTSLESMGCKFSVHGTGLIPDIFHAEKTKVLPIHEKAKHNLKIAVAFLWQGGDESTKELARLMIKSVRRSMPEVSIIHVTTDTFPACEGVDEVFRVKRDTDFADWSYAALIQFMESSNYDGVIQIGTDVIIQDDVSSIFINQFDIASCKYPLYTRTDGAYCGDVNFIKKSGIQFLKDALFYYKTHTEIQDGWEGYQTAYLEIVKKKEHNFKELEYNAYCFTPESPVDDISKAFIVHYRGNRKVWMLNS